VLGEIFGLSIGKGMLNNILAQVQRPLEANAACIAEDVRAGRVVCSDRTEFRVAGRSW